MTLNDYQNHTDKTALYPAKIADFMMETIGLDPASAMENRSMERLLELIYTTLGLTGEAGELANKIKKVLRGDFIYEDIRKDLIYELGDCLWYVAQIARALDICLEDIAAFNLQKLQRRLETGTLQGSGDNREEEVTK